MNDSRLYQNSVAVKTNNAIYTATKLHF